MSAPYNEPAFPVVSPTGEQFSGMTLRDYFAAKAMQGDLAAQDVRNDGKGTGVVTADFDSQVEFARRCYSLADAMLKARNAIATREGDHEAMTLIEQVARKAGWVLSPMGSCYEHEDVVMAWLEDDEELLNSGLVWLEDALLGSGFLPHKEDSGRYRWRSSQRAPEGHADRREAAMLAYMQMGE